MTHNDTKREKFITVFNTFVGFEVQRPVVRKLLLKSNTITLLPLLVKETSYFYSVTYFYLQRFRYNQQFYFFKCNENITSYYKKELVHSGTITLLHLTHQKMKVKALKRYFLYSSIEIVTIRKELCKINVKKIDVNM